MDSLKYVSEYFKNSLLAKQNFLEDVKQLQSLISVADLVAERLKNGNKLLIAGNGGSAADSQHIAAEFVSRFNFDRPGMPAIALTTDTSALTAIGNDYGFENLFSRQVQALGGSRDIFLGITTSGKSKNILKAFEQAKKKSITTIAFTGSAGLHATSVDFMFSSATSSTPHTQELHICLGHLLCGLVEELIYGN